MLTDKPGYRDYERKHNLNYFFILSTFLWPSCLYLLLSHIHPKGMSKYCKLNMKHLFLEFEIVVYIAFSIV